MEAKATEWERTIENSELTTSLLVMNDKLNLEKHMHGGEIVKLLDEAAGCCAGRYCGGRVNTVAFHSVNYIRPVKLFRLFVTVSRVIYAGETSMLVEQEAYEEDIYDQRELCCTAYSTFVALTPEREKRKVPPLQYKNEEERRRAESIMECIRALRETTKR